MRQWRNARESIARTLSVAKRPAIRFGGGDIRALLNATLYSQTSSSCWDLNLQDALFWSLLYATGARPGELACSRGYREDGHYLKVEDSTVAIRTTADLARCGRRTPSSSMARPSNSYNLPTKLDEQPDVAAVG